MMIVHVDIVVVLAAIEALLLLLGLSGFLWFRGRKLAQALASAPKRPTAGHPIKSPAPSTYASFLGAELAHADELAGIEGVETQSTETGETESASPDNQALLAIRRKFIENELGAQEVAGDPEKYRERLLTGLHTIEFPAAPIGPAEAAKLSRRYEEELGRLRAVIGNQHDIMRELESIVANSSADETAQAARRQLALWESQAAEFERCVGVLEMENQRLRTEHPKTAAPSAEAEQDGQIRNESEELRSLIGNQQETITQLNELVQGLVPEAEKAKKLNDIIGRIERANQELNTCVAVLEGENDMLRGRVRELESAAPDDGAHPPEHAARIQELEGELQFKDTAIEELQQQYKALESKYLALQGKGAQDS